MRFIYKVVLGIMIFNAVLILLAGYFPTSDTIGTPEDITGDSDYTKYKLGGTQTIFTFDVVTVTVMGVSIGLGILGALAIRSTIPLAAGLVGGLVSTLYLGPATILMEITQNTIVVGIITLLGILLGIMVGFIVLEWLANQAGADN